ncbi:hypothetical protein T4B_3203, partial [Trichinella pseudospiralis]
LHLYSSSSVKLMVDKDRNTFHFFNHMSNGPLNSSKSNEGRQPYCLNAVSSITSCR